MFVGVARLSLVLGQSRSLKEKRKVVRRIVDRVRARFTVAIAEVDHNDLWQKATLGIAAVGNEQAHVRQMVDEVVRAIEELYLAPIVSCEVHVDSYGDFHSGSGSSVFSEETGGLVDAGGAGGSEHSPDPSLRELLAGLDEDRSYFSDDPGSEEDFADDGRDEDDFEASEADGIEDAPWAKPLRRRR